MINCEMREVGRQGKDAKDSRKERSIRALGRDHAIWDGWVWDFWPVIPKVRIRLALRVCYPRHGVSVVTAE